MRHAMMLPPRVGCARWRRGYLVRAGPSSLEPMRLHVIVADAGGPSPPASGVCCRGVGGHASMSRHDPIGEIYDAAFEDDGLQRMAAILVRASACRHRLRDTRQRSEARHRHVRPAAGVRGELRGLLRQDKSMPARRRCARSGPALRAVRATEMVPELVYRQSEFFVDFARRYDTFEEIGGPIPLAPGLFGDWCVHRGRHNKRFDERDRDRLGAAIAAFAARAATAPPAGHDRGVKRSASPRSTPWRSAWWSAMAPARILFANTAAEAHARSGDGLVLGGSRATASPHSIRPRARG